MNELVALIDQQCRACGRELSPSEVREFECRTDGTADDVLYCPAHVPSYLTLCLECCGVYTADLGGICRYCLESTSVDEVLNPSLKGNHIIVGGAGLEFVFKID